MTEHQIDPRTAFSGEIKRPGAGFFYTLGLLGVAFVMALLPLIYFALVGLVIYATHYHAVHNFKAIMGTGPSLNPRLVILKFFIYATPVFVGTILSLFMVKPIFARRLDRHQPYGVNPEVEPVLYGLIERICRMVGAPMPSLIELDCGVNAGAGLRRGFASFWGGELCLLIGLPLVAGLSVREFAGVIAHELGHCTQGVAMRLSFIIHRIDDWFARLIFERDSWDEWLDEMGQTEEAGFAFMVGIAQLGVWLSRKILMLLLLFGHAFGCYLSRRMEFHADLFAIRLAGSAAFESTKTRVRLLRELHDAGLYEMRVAWNVNKRLPDNLPQFMLNTEKSMRGAAVKKALKGRIGFVETGLFHTHPSDADRIRVARQADAAGVVAVDAPATALFANFAAPARIVTTLYYQGIGLPLGLAKIYEVEGAAPAVEKSGDAPTSLDDLARAAVDRFFFGVVTPLRPVFPKA